MNEEYYVLEEGEKVGPFTFDELIDRGIEVDTSILVPLGQEWQNASYIPEFIEYFQSIGYHFPTEDNLASPGRRIAAFLIDYFSIGFCAMFIAVRAGWMIFPPPTVGLSAAMESMMSKSSYYYFELSFAGLFFIYNTFFENTAAGGSLGKKIFNLRVVDADGRNEAFMQSVVRNVGVLTVFNIVGPLSLIAIVALIVSFFASKTKQTWYEYFSKTYVIKEE